VRPQEQRCFIHRTGGSPASLPGAPKVGHPSGAKVASKAEGTIRADRASHAHAIEPEFFARHVHYATPLVRAFDLCVTDAEAAKVLSHLLRKDIVKAGHPDNPRSVCFIAFMGN
jgi:hypothetical protein